MIFPSAVWWLQVQCGSAAPAPDVVCRSCCSQTRPVGGQDKTSQCHFFHLVEADSTLMLVSW